MLFYALACTWISTSEDTTRRDADGDRVPVHLDCDDADPEVGLATTWYQDADGDGHGALGSTIEACVAGEGWAASDDDCDDGNPGIHAGATEVCDDVDQDCDELVDEDPSDGGTWYADADGDGFGTGEGVVACDQPADHSADAGDCDDTNLSIFPGADEHCDDVDEDCDGSIDEDAIDMLGSWPDGDGDGYGTGDETLSCEVPSGNVMNSGDCDDADPSVSPGENEACFDGIDNDCDGVADTCDVSTVALDEVESASGYHHGDKVGASLATGDLDGDDYSDMLIGAPGYEGTGRGGAHVLLGEAAMPGQLYMDDVFTLMGNAASEYAGADVALGDYDGDGLDDIVVSAPYASFYDGTSGSYYTGMVNLFGNGSEDWSQPGSTAMAYADGKIYGGPSAGELGTSVALLGAEGGDGRKLAVGIPLLQNGGGEVGGACVYEAGEWSARSWESVEYCVVSAGSESWLGWDIDGLGDVVGGDGVSDLVAGGPFASYLAQGESGVAVVVDGDGWGGKVSTADAEARFFGSAGDELGSAVLSPGDLDGDGYDDLVVGAPSRDAVRGAVFVFSGPVSGTSLAVATATGRIDGAQVVDRFGDALAAGDTDADGQLDLLVGAPQAIRDGEPHGEAYAFRGAIVGAWSADDAILIYQADDHDSGVGYALATGRLDDDDRADVLIGAPWSSYDGDETGRVYFAMSEDVP